MKYGTLIGVLFLLVGGLQLLQYFYLGYDIVWLFLLPLNLLLGLHYLWPIMQSVYKFLLSPLMRDYRAREDNYKEIIKKLQRELSQK